MKTINYLAVIGLSLLLTTNSIKAQELPQPSPSAKVEQRIGLTDVTVVYSRPSVKGRTIWGELVPFDKVWRTGANANTLVTFSDDVTIEGQSLEAGTYSFFIIPTEGEWKVIFNTATDGWGTSNYDEGNNVLHLNIEPREIEGSPVESLRYTFEDLKSETANLVLAWESMQVILEIEVEVERKAWLNIEKALAEVTSENKAEVYRNAAKYTVTTKKKLKEGLVWINRSIEAKESWYSYWVKADVQHANGDNKGAVASAKKAIAIGEAGATDAKPFKYKARLEKAIAEYK